MTKPSDPRAELRAAVSERRAMLVAGTGVSMGATGGADEASWAGLLRHGLRFLREHGLVEDAVADAHLNLIGAEGVETHHFISAAADVTRGMGGRQSEHYSRWLRETVGSLTVADDRVLCALKALREHGNLLATTNYDGLLLDGCDPVTWAQTDEFLRAVRHRETDKLLFLHGFWRHSESVVLDWGSYDEIVRDERFRSDQLASWQASTWVYVGCGSNGLSDPDLGLLLSRYGQRLRSAGLWDYMLVRDDQQEEIQAYFDGRGLNVIAVSFGQHHADLAGFLRSLLLRTSTRNGTPDDPPAAREFVAVPDYLGSHDFVGRASELRDLDDWAKPADRSNLLLIEAIGGNGKSMLTWNWVNAHAPRVREDWAGRFWYSFYERDAVMADFCRQALAYMTGEDVENFGRIPQTKLEDALVAELHARPWLLVLDGLERVLVAYHGLDAAGASDGRPADADEVAQESRPTATIREEDGDLLRRLAGARPSKILVSSRLTPQVLLNPAGQPVPGVKRHALAGLRPDDGEELFRSSGAFGASARIRLFLTESSDNHPLVIGVLAGLVVNYLPARGNFDVWADDGSPAGGARLDLADLDLTQRRNHILGVALGALSERSRDLLSTIALFPDAMDYETLRTLNPFLPPEPPPPDLPFATEIAERLHIAEDDGEWRGWWYNNRATEARELHQRQLDVWRRSPPARRAEVVMGDAVRDLEQRGVVQYDHLTRRYDLHPVVRGFALDGVASTTLERHGQRLVDLFTSRSVIAHENVRTVDDVAPAIHLVRTLQRLGRYAEAANTYRTSSLPQALFRLEAYAEVVALLRPFFGEGWGEVRLRLAGRDLERLTYDAGAALAELGEKDVGRACLERALVLRLEDRQTFGILDALIRIALACRSLADRDRAVELLEELAQALGSDSHVSGAALMRYALQSQLGRGKDADETWQLLLPAAETGLSLRSLGHIKVVHAHARFARGQLSESDLQEAWEAVTSWDDPRGRRDVLRLRGRWHLGNGEWAPAAEALSQAVNMARERRLSAGPAEVELGLAKHALGLLDDEEARGVAKHALGLLDDDEAPSRAKQHTRAAGTHLAAALLWRAAGDDDNALRHAYEAYDEAWDVGAPYVDRHALDRAVELLEELGADVPPRAPFAGVAEDRFRWEADVRALIERQRARRG